jgi:hypothetical protein
VIPSAFQEKFLITQYYRSAVVKKENICLKSSVSDPDSLIPDPDPVFLAEYILDPGF